jgi:xanthine dehydrogenase molybdopterin-binding subunit B
VEKNHVAEYLRLPQQSLQSSKFYAILNLDLNVFRYRQPVSFMVERFDDMAVSGTRHPFYFNYKVGS